VYQFKSALWASIICALPMAPLAPLQPNQVVERNVVSGQPVDFDSKREGRSPLLAANVIKVDPADSELLRHAFACLAAVLDPQS
jgi:hypothetical protein